MRRKGAKGARGSKGYKGVKGVKGTRGAKGYLAEISRTLICLAYKLHTLRLEVALEFAHICEISPAKTLKPTLGVFLPRSNSQARKRLPAPAPGLALHPTLPQIALRLIPHARNLACFQPQADPQDQ